MRRTIIVGTGFAILWLYFANFGAYENNLRTGAVMIVALLLILFGVLWKPVHPRKRSSTK